jgi:NADPH:quinone reductase-like Zn-dependent oxidoreductase
VFAFTGIGLANHGAFADYVILPESLTGRLPANLSFEQGATLGLGTLTAGIGLFKNMQLPLPSTVPKAPNQTAGGNQMDEWLLVWGGSSSVGSYAIQFASNIGMKIVSTCSQKNFQRVKNLGASHVFDYKSPTVVEDIIRLTNRKLRFVYDAIGQPDAQQKCIEILNSYEGTTSANQSQRSQDYSQQPQQQQQQKEQQWGNQSQRSQDSQQQQQKEQQWGNQSQRSQDYSQQPQQQQQQRDQQSQRSQDYSQSSQKEKEMGHQKDNRPIGVTVLQYKGKLPNDNVRFESFVVSKIYQDPNEQKWLTTLYKEVNELVAAGKIKPNEIEVLPNGLDSVKEGLNLLQNKQVSAKKLVIKMQ